MQRTLEPVVARVCRSHSWQKFAEIGPRHIKESLDDEKIKMHLAGENVYGACPINPGESTCRIALFDLDSHSGETAFEEMLKVAREIKHTAKFVGLNAVPFRSSGGNGIHLYFIWDEPQDAYSVRTAMLNVIEVCGYSNGTKGVAEKQIEIFPKQDSVPLDGFGSMFILPYAGHSDMLNPGEGWRVSDPVTVLPKPERKNGTVRQREIGPESGAAAGVAGPTEDHPLLVSALKAIPNDGVGLDYDTWRNVIFGIHDETGGSDEGHRIAVEFSSRSNKFDQAFFDDRVWPYARSDRDGPRITVQSVYRIAREHGWRDDVLADFDVLPDGSMVGDASGGVASSELEGKAHGADRFPVYGPGEFLTRPPLRWIVKKLVPQAQLGMVFGDSGSGKSFWSLDLACHIARGIPWRGNNVRQQRVVYCAAEGAAGFGKRIAGYARHSVVDPASLDIRIIDRPPNLMEMQDALDLAKAIKRCGPVGVVFIDTLAQVTPGANENAGEDMGTLTYHCRLIAQATGAVVILVHHTGKDAGKGARGHSSLRAACDFMIEIVNFGKSRIASVYKMKDGEQGAEYGFELTDVMLDEMDDDCELITTCVITHTDKAAPAKLQSGQNRDHSRAMADRIMAALERLGGVSSVPERVPYESLIAAVKDMMVPPEPGKKDRRGQYVREGIQRMVDEGELENVNGFVQKIAG